MLDQISKGSQHIYRPTEFFNFHLIPMKTFGNILLLILYFFSSLFDSACGQTASNLSYEAWIDSIESNTYIASTFQLDELVILSDLSQPFDNNRHLRKHHLVSVDKMMNRMPGVSMMRRGNYAAEPMMRGLTSDRVQVRIDDMLIFGACTDKMDPVTSYVETNNLSGIDLSFGNAGIMQGGMTGGNINMKLKKPQFIADKTFTVTTAFRYASESGQIEELADVNYWKNNWGVRASFAHRKAGDYRTGGGEVIPYSGFEKINYSLAVTHKNKKDQLLTLTYLGDQAFNIGYPALPMDVSSAKANIIAADWYAATLFKGIFTDVKIKGYYNKVVHVMDDSNRPDVPIRMDMPGWTTTTGLVAKTNLFIAPDNDKSYWNARLDIYNTDQYAEMTMYPEGEKPMFMLTWPGINRQSVAINSTYEHNLSTEHKVQIGGRLELVRSQMKERLGEQQISVFGFENELRSDILPSIQFAYTFLPNEAFEINTHLSMGKRIPNTSELYGFYLFNRQDNFDYLGDPTLLPETAWQTEMNLKWKTGQSWILFRPFYYRFNNYILGIHDSSLSAMTIGASGVKWYTNVASARLWGGEIQAQLQLNDQVKSISSFQYSQGEDINHDPLPFIPPFKWSQSLYIRTGPLSLQPEMVFSAAQNRISKKNREQNTPSFWLFHFRMTYNTAIWQGQKLVIESGVENLTDLRYREHIDWGGLPRPGRNIYLSLRYKF